MIKLKLFVLSFFGLFLSTSFAFAQSDFEKDCLNQIQNSIQKHEVVISNSILSDFGDNAKSVKSSVDQLLLTYLDNPYFLIKKINDGTKSSLKNSDIINVYNLFNSGISDEYLYSQEYGTQYLDFANIKTPLYCYATTILPLTDKKLDNLLKGDIGIVDAPSVFEIEINNSFKEVYIEKIIRDKYQLPLFTKKEIFLIPNNPENKSYNTYLLVDERKKAWGSFQVATKDLYNKTKNSPTFKQIYKDNEITVEIASEMSNGIIPLFVNEVIFNHIYFAWNRHYVYMAMLLNSQDLVKNIISIANKEFSDTEQLSWLDWVKFFRYETVLDLAKVDVADYFKQLVNIARYEYVVLFKDGEAEYTGTEKTIFKNYLENLYENNQENFLNVLKEKRVNNYKDFSENYLVNNNYIKEVSVGEEFTYHIKNTNASNQINVTFTDGTPLPDWLKFDNITRTLIGTPESKYQGVYKIMIQEVDSNFNKKVIDKFEIHVKGDGTNLESIPKIAIKKGEEFIYFLPEGYLDYKVSLENGDPLPAWLEFDTKKSLLRGTADAVGDLKIQVLATGTGGVNLFDKFEIQVGEDLENNLGSQSNIIQKDVLLKSTFFNKGVYLILGGLLLILIIALIRKRRG